VRISQANPVGASSAAPPRPRPDLSALSIPLQVIVGQMLDQDPSARRMTRDRLATYIRQESQGPMSLSAARKLNEVLEALGVDPVFVPEAPTPGTFEGMLRELRSVDTEWRGGRFVPMTPQTRQGRASRLSEVVDQIANAGVSDTSSLTPQELASARQILISALRAP